MKIRNLIRIVLAFVYIFVFLGMISCSLSRNTIQLKDKEGGGYLVDSKGMSLYYYKKDFPSISACINECLNKWPIFFTEKVAVQKPLREKDFGVFVRDEGQKQTTYKGWPLYYFSKDEKPGDMKGEGINSAWYVICPDKFAP